MNWVRDFGLRDTIYQGEAGMPVARRDGTWALRSSGAEQSRMVAFHFKVHREGSTETATTRGEYPDCGMAFRAARTLIRQIRAEEKLTSDVLERMSLEVTYDDGSELFRLPFSLGI